MIHIGTQYYRPPFPDSRYWATDFSRIAEAGLNAVQLWVVWGWVEPTPGAFEFDDYDRLVDQAHRTGLGVVLSTIAEIHPHWIHRIEPGSEMITNMGHVVVSSCRRESHVGLTPGGCFDHPGVSRRMRLFLEAVARRYHDHPAVVGWDVWNELRWNEQSDGLVCYCPNTLRLFRAWLADRYGDLDGLNAVWKRRYACWEDVLPGKMPLRPYTEMIAFQEFLTDRSNRHAAWRYDAVKEIVGSAADVTVHGGKPSVLYSAGAYPDTTALDRGNDWVLAECVDGIGCSSFPLWKGREISPVALYNRFEFLRSAAGSRALWLSELQGGRSNEGFSVSIPVDPIQQQRWIWNGFAIGVEKVLLWCWRDEVFGRESGGFGFAGDDGLYEARAEAMRLTATVIRSNGELLQSYRPERSRIGLFFSPTSHYLYWAQEGTAQRPLDAVLGYADAISREGFDFEMVEEHHLSVLDSLRLLILPRTAVLSDAQAAALVAWVRAGGRLILEAECGAFSPEGFYRYPQDRPFVQVGVHDIGRRELLAQNTEINSRVGTFQLPATDWCTPFLTKEGQEAHSLDHSVGRGSVLALSSFAGNAYAMQTDTDGEAAQCFRAWLSAESQDAGILPPAEMLDIAPGCASDPLLVKIGHALDKTVLFMFLPKRNAQQRIRFDPQRIRPGRWYDIMSKEILTVDRDGCSTVPGTAWGVLVLVYDDNQESS